MKIKINQSQESCTQHFNIYTPSQWESAREQFPENTNHFFTGQKGEFFVLNKGQQTYYLIGIPEPYKTFEVQETGNKLASQYRENLQAVPTQIHADFLSKEEQEAFMLGLFIGTYQYPFTEQHAFWQPGFQLLSTGLSPKESQAITRNLHAISKGQLTSMEWLNKPFNYKSVEQLSDFLKETAKNYNLTYKAFNREEAKEKGLGAFAAVNQGSSMDGAFTILEYRPNNLKAEKHLGLIGKCVLFDTGGISLKDANHMHYMKSDMGGATAMIGTLIAIAELQLPINVTLILPITDNAIGSKAYIPSDVVTAYNGKTVEILNTDAEGRLTLSDALAYMTKNYETDVLIDMATLTGSVVRMFGETCGALFSNNEDLKRTLLDAGDQTHQRLWNLPLWEVWEEELKSSVADFKNISMKPVGDCIIAAKLLQQFIGDHPNWAHMDMAAMAFGTVNYTKEKAATGYGVQLLLNYINALIEE